LNSDNNVNRIIFTCINIIILGEQRINDKITNQEAKEELQFAILAQAIRDCASVDRMTQVKSIEWFISDEFKLFCEELKLDTHTLRESMMSVMATPSAMLKDNAEDTISSLRASLWQKKANS